MTRNDIKQRLGHQATNSPEKTNNRKPQDEVCPPAAFGHAPGMQPPAARSFQNLFPSEAELRPETDPVTGIDLSLIKENLKLTPWERIQANDNTVNFCDMSRAVMQQRRHAAA